METDEFEEDEASETAEEVYLSVWHCIGLVLFFITLAAWTDWMLGLTNNPVVREETWIRQAILGSVAGILTAAAASVLSGISFDDVFPGKAISLGNLASVILATFGFSVVANQVAIVLVHLKPLPPETVDLFSKLATQSLGSKLLVISVIAPVTEELIFRGMMFEGLRVRYTTSSAVLITTFLFASIHLPLSPWHALIAFLFGLFLVWLKISSESLILCMLAHSFYNTFPDILDAFQIHINGYNVDIAVTSQPLTFNVVGVACLIAGVIGIYSSYQGESPQAQKEQTA